MRKESRLRSGSRRLLPAAAGLLLALGTLLATAAPAHASHQLQHSETEAHFIAVCEGTYVILDIPPDSLDPNWSIEAGGDSFWPPGDSAPGPGGAPLVFVPRDADTIKVDFADSSGPDWPREHTWEEPTGCSDLPAPAHTAPTCEAPGEITIPDLPAQAVGDVSMDNAAYRLDGEPVEPGSTHVAEPGSYVVALVLGEDDTRIALKTWGIDLTAPACPNGTLAETGARLVLMGGGALVLLTLGGGLYLMARRQISFVP